MQAYLSQVVQPGRMQNMLQERVSFLGVFMSREAALAEAQSSGWLAMADVFALPAMPLEIDSDLVTASAILDRLS